MAERPSLHIAVAGQKSKASEYNDNFDMMMDYVEDSVTESKEYVDSSVGTLSGVTSLSNSFSTLVVNALYPVGSIYIGVTENCPLASITGTWEKIADGRVLQGSDETHEAGTTIAAGLPNITGTVTGHGQWASQSGAFYWGSYTGSWRTKYEDASGYKINFDASRSSSVYGNSTTVQPPAYVVNIWKRTA